MFHTQCAWNLAQAFQATDYDFASRSFTYEGKTIPHLDFSIDKPNPAKTKVTVDGIEYDFTDYSATLNPDSFVQRINAMCLIEFPDWAPQASQEIGASVTNYASIGHFYQAIKNVLTKHTEFNDGTKIADAIKPDQHQVNWFDNAPSVFNGNAIIGAVNGTDYLTQATNLITTIVEEGEGTSSHDTGGPTEYQYDTDATTHFEQFIKIKSACDKGTISQNPLSDSGVETITGYLKNTFLAQVQTFFSAGDPAGAFWNRMIAFDLTIANAFTGGS